MKSQEGDPRALPQKSERHHSEVQVAGSLSQLVPLEVGVQGRRYRPPLCPVEFIRLVRVWIL